MGESKMVIISSVAGGGKSTLIELILKRHPDAFFSVSCTTRDPRPGDIPGKSYIFLSIEEFKAKIEKQEFFEFAEVHGNFYGTPKTPILKALEEKKTVLLDIDVQGASHVKAMKPEAISVFIQPPSLEIWKARLRKRGTDRPEVIEKRIQNGLKELGRSIEFDYVIVNDNLEIALEELDSIIYPNATQP